MALRLPQVQSLLGQALAERRGLEQEVAAATLAVARARERLDECRRECDRLREAPQGQVTAAARLNRERYAQRLRRRDVELEGEVGQALIRLEQRRAQLVQAARQVRLWERLSARLEQEAARRELRSEQEIIDQFGQRRPGAG